MNLYERIFGAESIKGKKCLQPRWIGYYGLVTQKLVIIHSKHLPV